MKEVMSFQEAALDPNRPLSITPREWMYAVEAEMSSEKELVDNSVLRIAQENNVDYNKVKGLEKIELGVDQIVEGIKIVTQGLIDAKNMNLEPTERDVVNKINDLVNTALSPYTVDIIEELDKLEEE